MARAVRPTEDQSHPRQKMEMNTFSDDLMAHRRQAEVGKNYRPVANEDADRKSKIESLIDFESGRIVFVIYGNI
jgi:hypothetical protein